jgi:hypothetical protein
MSQSQSRRGERPTGHVDHQVGAQLLARRGAEPDDVWHTPAAATATGRVGQQAGDGYPTADGDPRRGFGGLGQGGLDDRSSGRDRRVDVVTRP